MNLCFLLLLSLAGRCTAVLKGFKGVGFSECIGVENRFLVVIDKVQLVLGICYGFGHHHADSFLVQVGFYLIPVWRLAGERPIDGGPEIIGGGFSFRLAGDETLF